MGISVEITGVSWELWGVNAGRDSRLWNKGMLLERRSPLRWRVGQLYEVRENRIDCKVL
ncbi:hypothetical protein NG799_15965 [Laspinema sp. D1]|uniref:Uncharacterized protein n=1 Tax=Laspinema palackyanum D2a TaxID=2953684 RepID=A0ABT2MWR0_9CYAN|nr:hypothetical protein [Laspinema sp. D2a]